MSDLLAFVEAFCRLAPEVTAAAVLIGLIIDFAKRLGFPDGYAGLASAVLNAFVWGVLFFAERAESAEEVVSIIDNLTVIAPSLLALLWALLSSKVAHLIYDWLGIGFSYPD